MKTIRENVQLKSEMNIQFILCFSTKKKKSSVYILSSPNPVEYSIHTLLLNKKKIIFSIYYIPFHVKLTLHNLYIS